MTALENELMKELDSLESENKKLLQQLKEQEQIISQLKKSQYDLTRENTLYLKTIENSNKSLSSMKTILESERNENEKLLNELESLGKQESDNEIQKLRQELSQLLSDYEKLENALNSSTNDIQSLQTFFDNQKQVLENTLQGEYKNLDDNFKEILQSLERHFKSRANEVLKAVSMKLEHS